MNQTAFNKLLFKINIDDLLCPVCYSQSLKADGQNLVCNNIQCKQYQIVVTNVNGKPVLINFDESLISKDYLLKSDGHSIVVRTESAFKKTVRNFFRGRSKITEKNVSHLGKMIHGIANPSILVIGGGEIGAGLGEFYHRYGNSIVSFDIYDSNNIDFIADGHQIPVKDNHFDVVIIQAVLEHVLDPFKVVSEITRVLKPGSIVYAETPFMQQVHEGPYDFTRFTESGHRYLFRHYILESSGYTAGAGYTLLWSLDFFFSGLFRSRKAGKLVRILFFWLRFFDRIIPTSYNTDAACGVYFLGRKAESPIADKQIIEHYQGNQV